MDGTIRAAYLEELRFAKRQQWAVAIATLTFIAGAYTITKDINPPLGRWEKNAVWALVSAAAVAGSYLPLKLDCHLRRTRLAIDQSDRTYRGLDISIGLAIALLISAGAVCYAIWRDP
jgi:hypothetical protein